MRSIFVNKQSPKPSDPVVAEPVPAEPAKPKFKPFDADDYKAATLEAKYELEIILRDGGTLRIIRNIFAMPRSLPFGLWDYAGVTFHAATEESLHTKLRETLKDMGREGLFLGGNDKYLNEDTIYQAGQFIPPANIASIAYRKVEEL